jgi:hypothetical protein
MANYTERVKERQAEALAGEELGGATVVYPPGSSLYKVAVGKGKAGLLAGPLGSVIAGKLENRGLEGAAAAIPRSWGVLALTRRRLLWFDAKASLRGPQPKELLLQWPVDQIESFTYEAQGLKKYPTFVLTFKDGSAIPLVSEKTHQPDVLARAWESLQSLPPLP